MSLRQIRASAPLPEVRKSKDDIGTEKIDHSLKEKSSGLTPLIVSSSSSPSVTVSTSASSPAPTPSPTSTTPVLPLSLSFTGGRVMTERQQLRWLMRATSEPEKDAGGATANNKSRQTQRRRADEESNSDDSNSDSDSGSEEEEEGEEEGEEKDESMRSSSSRASSRESSPVRASRPSMLRHSHSHSHQQQQQKQQQQQQNDLLPRCIRRPLEFANWPLAQQKAWLNIKDNPDAYYFDYLPPGVVKKRVVNVAAVEKGDATAATAAAVADEWSSSEVHALLYALVHHPPEGQWGLFSMHVPGRTGRECKRKVEEMIRKGELMQQQQREKGRGGAAAAAAAGKGKVSLAPQLKKQHNFDSTPLLVAPPLTSSSAAAAATATAAAGVRTVIARVCVGAAPGTEGMKHTVAFDVAVSSSAATAAAAKEKKEKERERREAQQQQQQQTPQSSSRGSRRIAVVSPPASSSSSVSAADASSQRATENKGAKRKLAAILPPAPAAAAAAAAAAVTAAATPSLQQTDAQTPRDARVRARREHGSGSGVERHSATVAAGAVDFAAPPQQREREEERMTDVPSAAAAAAATVAIAPLFAPHLKPSTIVSSPSPSSAAAAAAAKILPFAHFSIPAHTPYYPSSPPSLPSLRAEVEAKRRRLIAPAALERKRVDPAPAVQRNPYPSAVYTPLPQQYVTTVDITGRLSVQPLTPQQEMEQQQQQLESMVDVDNSGEVAERMMFAEGGGGAPAASTATAPSTVTAVTAAAAVAETSIVATGSFAAAAVDASAAPDSPSFSRSFSSELLRLEQRYRVQLRRLSNMQSQQLRAIAAQFNVRPGSENQPSSLPLQQQMQMQPEKRRPFFQPRNTFAGTCRRGLEEYFNNRDVVTDSHVALPSRCATYAEALAELRNAHRSLLKELQREYATGKDVLLSLKTAGVLQ